MTEQAYRGIGHTFRTARVFDGTEPDGRPHVDRQMLDEYEAGRVLAYLETAPVVHAVEGYGLDRIDPGRGRSVPLTWQTDGTWIWPGAVTHYLRSYALPPDPEFLIHIRQRNFQPPMVTSEVKQAAMTAVFGGSGDDASRRPSGAAAAVPRPGALTTAGAPGGAGLATGGTSASGSTSGGSQTPSGSQPSGGSQASGGSTAPGGTTGGAASPSGAAAGTQTSGPTSGGTPNLGGGGAPAPSPAAGGTQTPGRMSNPAAATGAPGLGGTPATSGASAFGATPGSPASGGTPAAGSAPATGGAPSRAAAPGGTSGPAASGTGGGSALAASGTSVFGAGSPTETRGGASTTNGELARPAGHHLRRGGSALSGSLAGSPLAGRTGIGRRAARIADVPPSVPAASTPGVPSVPDPGQPRDDSVNLDRLRAVAVELGLSTRAYRVGAAAEGAWSVLREGAGWAVFRSVRGAREELATFPTSHQATAYLVGQLYLSRGLAEQPADDMSDSEPARPADLDEIRSGDRQRSRASTSAESTTDREPARESSVDESSLRLGAAAVTPGIGSMLSGPVPSVSTGEPAGTPRTTEFGDVASTHAQPEPAETAEPAETGEPARSEAPSTSDEAAPESFDGPESAERADDPKPESQDEPEPAEPAEAETTDEPSAETSAGSDEPAPAEPTGALRSPRHDQPSAQVPFHATAPDRSGSSGALLPPGGPDQPAAATPDEPAPAEPTGALPPSERRPAPDDDRASTPAPMTFRSMTQVGAPSSGTFDAPASGSSSSLFSPSRVAGTPGDPGAAGPDGGASPGGTTSSGGTSAPGGTASTAGTAGTSGTAGASGAGDESSESGTGATASTHAATAARGTTGEPSEPGTGDAASTRSGSGTDASTEQPAASQAQDTAGGGYQQGGQQWKIQPLPGEPPLTLYRDKRMVLLPAGTEIDRYGEPTGNVTYASRTQYQHRSLPTDWSKLPYHVYRLQRPLEVLTGLAVPWFEQPGGGTAFVLPRSVADLLADGTLVEMEEPVAPSS